MFLHTLIILHYQSYYFKHFLVSMWQYSPFHSKTIMGLAPKKPEQIHSTLSLPVLVMGTLAIICIRRLHQNLRGNPVVEPPVFCLLRSFWVLLWLWFVGFASYVFWLGFYSSPKYGQKKPQRCLQGLPRGPGKEAKELGNRSLWFHPPYSNPDRHQPRSDAPFLPIEMQ